MVNDTIITIVMTAKFNTLTMEVEEEENENNRIRGED